MSNEVFILVSIEKDTDKKFMINAINCSMLDYPSTSDYDEI